MNLPELGISEALAMVDEEKSELDKIVEFMADPANISHFTELTRHEITAFSFLGSMARKYDLEMLKEYLRENLTLRVSKGRGGRAEIVKLASRQLTYEMELEGSQRGGFSRFFRGRRRGPENR